MSEDNGIDLQSELKDALQAINILTNRLINLAAVENKFLALTEELQHQEIKCSGILFSIESAEERIAYNISRKSDELKYFFTFRFKWMEKLFLRHKHL